MNAERTREREVKAQRAAKSETERKIQDNVDSQRAEAAQRKMAKQGGREWDAEKVDLNPRSGSRGARGGRGGPSRPSVGRSLTQEGADRGPADTPAGSSAVQATDEEKDE